MTGSGALNDNRCLLPLPETLCATDPQPQHRGSSLPLHRLLFEAAHTPSPKVGAMGRQGEQFKPLGARGRGAPVVGRHPKVKSSPWICKTKPASPSSAVHDILLHWQYPVPLFAQLPRSIGEPRRHAPPRQATPLNKAFFLHVPGITFKNMTRSINNNKGDLVFSLPFMCRAGWRSEFCQTIGQALAGFLVTVKAASDNACLLPRPGFCLRVCSSGGPL